MKIAIGNEHGGVELKQHIVKYLTDKGYEMTDLGSDDPIYANIAIKVGTAVAAGEYDRGILICGTGMGISIVACKVKGIRVCTCSDVYSAEMSKRHNNSNILTMGALVVGTEKAKMIARYWLTAEFEGGRHQRRIDMIEKIENGEAPDA